MAIKKSFARKIARLQEQLEELVEEMEEEARNMQWIYDDRSDKWKESEKGSSFEDCIAELEGAFTDVTEASEILMEWTSEE